MYFSAWLQAALLPDRWRVAGITVNALTVWHVFVLASRGNPFVCGPREACDMDAAMELLIYASGTYREGKALYSDPDLQASARRAAWKILSKREAAAVVEEVQEFAEFCTRVPGHKTPQEDGKKGATRGAAAPFAWILVDHLAAGDPDRIVKAWDTPYAVACCLFDAHRDVRGEDSTLETLAEAERFDLYLEGQKEKAS